MEFEFLQLVNALLKTFDDCIAISKGNVPLPFPDCLLLLQRINYLLVHELYILLHKERTTSRILKFALSVNC